MKMSSLLRLSCYYTTTILWFEWEQQFFKVKSVFKVPEEPKRAVPEEKFPKLKPRKEEEPPAKGTPTFPKIKISLKVLKLI